MHLCGMRSLVSGVQMVLVAGVIMMSSSVVAAQTTDAGFGPGNPFYAPSALPFQAPPFDRIKDSDYQPAIEAGMAEQLKEMRANTNPVLEKIQQEEAPRLAAHSDAIFLDAKLFHRVAAVHEKRESLKLSPEGLRLVEYCYQRFVHAGANLSDADKEKLKKINEEESTLSNAFRSKVLAATREAA